MLESVSANGHTFEECREAMKKSTSLSSARFVLEKRLVDLWRCLDISLDEGFKDFYQWVKEVDLPFELISRYVCCYPMFSVPAGKNDFPTC